MSNKGTIRRRDRSDGTCRWYLDFKNGEPWIPCGDFTRPEDRPKVEAWRDQYVATMARLGATKRAAGEETVSDWFGRYYDAAEKGSVGRKNRGRPQAAVADRRARFETWIKPVIGHLPMVKVESTNLRRVVAVLDEKIRERDAFYESDTADHKGRKPGVSHKTAAHVWSEVTSGFREACGSKDPSLQVRTDDPSRGVLPPTTGETREQEALYPHEVTQLLACERIPLHRRETYAVCIYAGLRRSEAERLEASDVDLEHDTIKIRGKAGKRGKTDAAMRSIPIEPALRPLLVILLARTPEGRLLDVPGPHGRNGAADLMRKDLARANLTRADLSRDDGRHMPFTFHGLRHTAITHWVLLVAPSCSCSPPLVTRTSR